MSRTPGDPALILFQQITPATVLKALNESADATSGGGARDLRLRPHDGVRSFMARLMPHTRTRARPGGGEVTIQWDIVTWDDGSQTIEVEYWPPTKTRPGEGRIARISSLPPLTNPPEDLEGTVVLFVRDENDVLWVRYATAEGLRKSFPGVGKVIQTCLASTTNERIATGYIDLTPGGLGSWCNSILARDSQ